MSENADKSPAFTALLEAQRLAFAPVAFQVAKVLRDRGILSVLVRRGRQGATIDELQVETSTSEYGLETLLETALSFGLVSSSEANRFSITRVGFFIDRDPMTRANLDFIHDVCYEGLFKLDEAIEKGEPAGLKVFGNWKTIYEGLSSLPAKAQKSWFAFDHFYSDGAFAEALKHVFAHQPKRLLDVGGNTGKFALRCCDFDDQVHITICDLPGQLKMARDNADAAGMTSRIDGHPIDLLNPSASFPDGADAMWMSQFLCCFSKEEIVSILKLAKKSMTAGTRLWIMDTFWDCQENAIAETCLHGSSPYFTVMANGNSRMYSVRHMRQCIEESGLSVAQQVDGIGLAHSLLECRLSE